MDIKLKTYLLNPIYSLLISTPQAQQGPRMVLVVKIGFFMKWFSIITY